MSRIRLQSLCEGPPRTQLVHLRCCNGFVAKGAATAP